MMYERTNNHDSVACVAQAELGESQWICKVQMDTEPLMFHNTVSVHINRSAHEIFKIYLFIEIFNAAALFTLQEAQRLSSKSNKLKFSS